MKYAGQEDDCIENWGLEDPSGKPDETFRDTIEKIKEKILDLKEKLQGKE